MPISFPSQVRVSVVGPLLTLSACTTPPRSAAPQSATAPSISAPADPTIENRANELLRSGRAHTITEARILAAAELNESKALPR